MQIEFSNVSRSFFVKPNKVLAVDNVSWQAEGGQVYGILGPNGSGKTTMIRMLVDLLRADSGDILVDGDPLGNRTDRFRRQLGYLPEERGLYKKLRALSFLIYLGQIRGLSRSEAKRRSEELLTYADLGESRTALLSGFSRGMSQRFQFISAIIHTPRLLILDEPFANLDPISVRFIRNTITELKQAGATILLCTHRMGEAEQLCDRVLMVRNGQILIQGDLQELRRKHGEKQIVVDARNSFDGFHTVAQVHDVGRQIRVTLTEQATSIAFLSEVVARGIDIHELHIEPPSLEEIYISLVAHENH